jgi:site-specific recombinase XerD
MASISFLYRSKKSSSHLTVRLAIRIDGKVKSIYSRTPILVDKNIWDAYGSNKTVRDVDRKNEIQRLKDSITELESHLNDDLSRLDLTKVDVQWAENNRDLLKNAVASFYRPAAPDVPRGLTDYFQYYLDARKAEISDAVRKKYSAVKNKLERFQDAEAVQFEISEVNENFKKRFAAYCREQNYAANTVQRDLKYIKTVCRHAHGEGVELHPQLDGLRLPKEKVPKVYLTFQEIEKIEELDNLKPYQENARDWLVISCYTGQRVSDFMRFTKAMLREQDGRTYIDFIQTKTNKKMTVLLHGKVMEILEKRGGDFPSRISDQRYNEYIKEVCQLAEIDSPTYGKKQVNIAEEGKKSIIRKVSGTFPKWELVTSHIGRRSYATNFYGTIPTSLLMYVTGHATEAMFREYIGKGNEDHSAQLANYY